MPSEVAAGQGVHARPNPHGRHVDFAVTAAAVVLVLALAMVALAVGGTPKTLQFAIAAVGAVLVFRFPLLFLAVILFAEQYSAGSEFAASTPWYNQVGRQLYTLSKQGVPVLVLLALAATVGVLVRQRRQQRSGRGGDVVAPLLLVGATYSAVLSLADNLQAGPRALPLAVGAASSWLLIAAGYVVGWFYVTDATRRRTLVQLLGAALVLKAGLAALDLATTGGITVDDQDHVAIFGPAIPLLGLAVVSAYQAGVSVRGWRAVSCLLSAAFVVVVSFRLTYFLTAALVVLLAPLLTQRPRALLRSGTTALLVVLAVAVLPASVTGDTASRISSSTSAASQAEGASSSQLHVNDVRLGLDLALEHPWLGVGINAPQDPRFANPSSTTIYVHDEFLQEWLRFGLPGLALTIALVVVLAGRGLLALRVADDVVSGAAASLCLFLVVPLLTAPYLATTQRLPVLVGVAAAAARYRRPGRTSSGTSVE